MIVVDASAALEVLLETPLGLRHADDIFGQERHAPALLEIEFTQTLRRVTLAREIEPHRAKLLLDIFADWSFVRHAHTPLLRRIWELRFAVSAYDAAYVALAEVLNMPLLTCDAKLARSHGHTAEIVLLS